MCLTGVNNSAARESRFVPCTVSSDSVNALSPLAIYPPTNEIQTDIKKVLEHKQSDAIEALSISIQILARKAGEVEVKEISSLSQN